MLQWPLLLSKKKKEPNERVRQTSHPSVYYWPALPLLLNPVSVTLRVRVTALTDTEQIMLSHVISSEHRALKGFFFHIKSIQSHFSQLFQGATVSLTCFVKTAAMQQTVSGNLIGSHGDQIQNRDNCGCEEKKNRADTIMQSGHRFFISSSVFTENGLSSWAGLWWDAACRHNAASLFMRHEIYLGSRPASRGRTLLTELLRSRTGTGSGVSVWVKERMGPLAPCSDPHMPWLSIHQVPD